MNPLPNIRPRVAAAVLTALAVNGFAWAQQSAQVVGTLEGHSDPVYAIAWSPDGKTLVTGGFDNSVRLWDAATRKEIKRFDGHSGLVLAVAPAPDGKRLLSGSLDKTAKVWQVPGGGPRQELAGHPAVVHALAIRPDGTEAVAGGGRSRQIWG